MSLDRRFSALTLLMLSTNGMVGFAWLFAPLYAAKIAGSASIIAWLLGGVITVIIALTFAELSVLFPVAGGYRANTATESRHFHQFYDQLAGVVVFTHHGTY